MPTLIKLGAYGLGAIGLLLVLGGLYFLDKGNTQMNVVNATATQLANASATTIMGWSLIILGIVVAVLGVVLSMIRKKL
jgi:hypothetical protein